MMVLTTPQPMLALIGPPIRLALEEVLPVLDPLKVLVNVSGAWGACSNRSSPPC